jgi:hypothetical protein
MSICANLASHFFEPRDNRANKSSAWGCAGDQAETFLHRQRFSSGPIGLACMRTKTALSHLCADHAPELQSIVALRPFLGFEKEDLRRYCQQNLVPWVEDPTNRDPAFARTRNRVDLQGVPRSQARYPCIAIVYWAVRLSALKAICGVEPGTPAACVKKRAHLILVPPANSGRGQQPKALLCSTSKKSSNSWSSWGVQHLYRQWLPKPVQLSLLLFAKLLLKRSLAMPGRLVGAWKGGYHQCGTRFGQPCQC